MLLSNETYAIKWQVVVTVVVIGFDEGGNLVDRVNISQGFTLSTAEL